MCRRTPPGGSAPPTSCSPTAPTSSSARPPTARAPAAGITLLSPKVGLSLGTAGNGWTHPHYAVSPGIPGDSGSPFLDDDGNALGVLSTLSILPTPLSNNASDFSRSYGYMQRTMPGVQLGLGTEALTPLTGGIAG